MTSHTREVGRDTTKVARNPNPVGDFLETLEDFRKFSSLGLETHKVGPGCSYKWSYNSTPIDGRKQMANCSYFTLVIGVTKTQL